MQISVGLQLSYERPNRTADEATNLLTWIEGKASLSHACKMCECGLECRVSKNKKKSNKICISLAVVTSLACSE